MKREVNMVNHYKVSKTGLFINIEQPLLAATLDCIVEDSSEPTTHCDGLLEVEYPYSARHSHQQMPAKNYTDSAAL